MTPEQREHRRIYMAAYRSEPSVVARQREQERRRRAAMTPEQKAAKHEQRRLWTQRRREQGIHTITLLPQAEYDRLFLAQHGRCAICRQPESSVSAKGRVRRLSIDHDHLTGRARALLCSRCNTAIALMREDPNIADRAAAYLRWEQQRDAAERMQEALG